MLVGTVKIIAYAVEETALAQAEALARGALSVLPVVRRSAGLLLTEVPGQERSSRPRAAAPSRRGSRRSGWSWPGWR